MSARILNCKRLAKIYRDDARINVNDIFISWGGQLRLVIVQVGDDDASNVYIRNKVKACEECGIECIVSQFGADVSQEKLLDYIHYLNGDNDTTGILVQMPLPPHINPAVVYSAIAWYKDVDGFNYYNVGRVWQHVDFEICSMSKAIVPCTAQGIFDVLIENHNYQWFSGKHCVIVGRSNIVGKPVAKLMLDADCTVTMCHSKTKNLSEICKQADILICSIGKPKFFTSEYIKPGATVIDVGINRDENGKLCGDVDFDDVFDVAGEITTVPGGIGLMTVAELMNNCVRAYDIDNNRKEYGLV